ncbi:MAG: signal recognition particle protein [Deltaproteobacteria bacterium]|jgi:signal recognition particle subunit SRP54|nr:signal recognition particle protein [Deltaproteobacteria bacterium]
MFDSLSERLNGIFRRLGGQVRLDEKNLQDGLRQVRLALLEADVNFKVARDFVDKVRERCLEQEAELNPGFERRLVRVVHEELVAILGGATRELNLRGREPQAVMLVGLQGSGKTTSTAKLAHWLRAEKHRPYLVPADVYRPAAIEQLASLAGQLDLPCFPSSPRMNPVDIAAAAMREARTAGYDAVLLDTAGRLHLDVDLMNELSAIKAEVSPAEILFVADALTGQEAVTAAEAFDRRLDFTGIILTKMDGDARGGAALSIKSVTGKNIKFVGMGEKISELEIFHPDRVAGRILGMGDILTLLEKTQDGIAADEAEALSLKLQKAEFNLDDFRANMRRLKKLGSLDGLLKLLPGLGSLRQKLNTAAAPEKDLARMEAIINSMTPAERRNPRIINGSRKLRIARGSGTNTAQVNQMLKHFEGMRAMMQNVLGGKKGKGGPGLPALPGMKGLAASLGGLGGLAGTEREEREFFGAPGAALSKSALKKKKLLRKARKNKKK